MFTAQNFKDSEGNPASPEAAAQIANKKVRELLQVAEDDEGHETTKYYALIEAFRTFIDGVKI